MEIKSRMVKFPSNGGTTPGFVAHPKEGGPYPVLVVIQEWWGLLPHIKEVAERFAAQGYYCLAPDLYHGQAAAEPDEARKLAMELDREQAVQEILAAGQHLLGMPLTRGDKFGTVGWCMGGSLSFWAAAYGDQVGASVVFYGTPRDDMLGDVHAPVQCHYGDQDQGIPLDTVENIRSGLSGHNKTYEVHVYPDSPHAFFNDTREQAYRPDAAKLAWERTLEWFGKYL